VSARFNALKAGQQPEDVEPLRSDDYLLLINGPNLSLFGDISEADLQANTCLRIKRTDSILPPSAVEIGGTERYEPTYVQFRFPREVSGRPTLAPDEKAVDFVCTVKGETLKTTFKLDRMVTPQGADL